MVGKVQQAEEQIKKRVPIGTRTSERVLKDYLISVGHSDDTIARAMNVLIQRGIMQFERRKQVLTRVAY
jgi:DNA replication licensing factor MCM5